MREKAPWSQPTGDLLPKKRNMDPPLIQEFRFSTSYCFLMGIITVVLTYRIFPPYMCQMVSEHMDSHLLQIARLKHSPQRPVYKQLWKRRTKKADL